MMKRFEIKDKIVLTRNKVLRLLGAVDNDCSSCSSVSAQVSYQPSTHHFERIFELQKAKAEDYWRVWMGNRPK